MFDKQNLFYLSINELFYNQLAQISKHIAIKDKDSSLTYEQLNQKSNQIAHWLIEKGIKKGNSVAILLDPGIDYIIIILSIIKAGGVYVPLDTLAPNSRLLEILDDVQPGMVIIDEIYLQKIKNCPFNLNLIKKINLQSTSYPKDPLDIEINPLDPVYIMYTSGSTGKPKGVIITHQAVINLAKVDNYAQIQKDTNVAQFSNLAFDGSTFEIWSALLHGVTLVIIPIKIRTNPIELRNYFETIKIHYLFLPTAYFHQLLKSEPGVLDPIDAIIFGGEQANPLLIKQYLDRRKKNNRPVTLINGYGPTEATTFTCRHAINEHSQLNENQLRSIGSPIENVKLYILDEQLNEVDEGELCISGINLALGYHHCIEQNKIKFINNPFSQDPLYSKMYRTGDRAMRLDTGEFLCLGRFDDQVKVGGFRVHLNEIERQLMQHDNISFAAVIVELGGGNHQILTAYIVFTEFENPLSGDEIRAFLETSLPIYMLPTKYVQVKEFPLTTVGKVDKKKLPFIEHTDLSFHADVSDIHYTEKTIKTIWQNLLNLKSIDTQKNFFDMGANSILLTEACHLINQRLNSNIQVGDLLTHPTIKKLTYYLEGDLDLFQTTRTKKASLSTDIAIIGMSCRLPSSPDLDSFWANLCDGIDCLTRFRQTTNESNYVPVRGILNGIDLFDAEFFGFSPADASALDPQHRIFLECVWEAIEHAGIAPEKRTQDIISVYAGMTDSTYLYENILKNKELCNALDHVQQRIATSVGMLSTLVSYKLNLKGRSINVNSACSTGLLTIDQACQDLMLGFSDTAIAGASSIIVPQDKGYTHYSGSIASQDGICRPFDDHANGTVFSNGVGVIVLKRLEDAIKDNHTIYAVIKGRGVNNDGAEKLGFAAPSMVGQVNCIKDALQHAQVNPEQIELVEAHGTATLLGDLVEINALKNVFAEQSDKTHFCALSSVKANIGHTDVASGITSLIKVALCLYYKTIPPQIHFTRPNPDFDLENSPFYVNTKLKQWDTPKERYASISSFGIGGTNVHLIVKEYIPPFSSHQKEQNEELFLFSAKSKQSLEQYQEKFSYYFENRTLKSQQFSNIAFTLKNGREDFAYRKFALGNNMISMTDMLKKQPYMKINSDIQFNMVWMFSGHRTQYHHMAMDLFNKIPRFKNSVLRGIEIANSYLNCDLLSLISDMENPAIHQIQYAEPALFIIEYALACLLLDCGIKPNILIGHGLGEYVAACIAGIFSFEDAIALVCERGLLIANTPKGEMLLVECSMEELSLYQSLANIDIAMHNTDENYVLSGTLKDINIVQSYLEKKQKPFQKLNTNHAFHSYLIESIELPFKAMFHNIKLSPPEMPIISNVTGTWMSAKEATDPEYWYQHLRQTIQFSQGINLLLTNKHPIFLEIGLGDVLSRFIKSKQRHQTLVIHTLPNRQEQISDLSQLLYSLGTIWSNGLLVNLKPLFDENDRQYIAIPTYTFQRKKYWIEPDKQQDNKSTIPVKMSQNEAHPISHSQIQQDLNMLFGKSLGVKNVGIDDDYFDLGGHSLTALKLIDEINKRYNAKLTIQTFYTSSTISKITQLLSNNINSKPIPIIFPFRINKESDKNIFICHPISGVVTGLKDLANALPDTYSVYGLQDPSISKGSLLYHDIKSIASAYLSEIVKIQSTGPYFLIGYSFGGTLVYEIAYQLKLQNKAIGLLCLIDSWAKHPPKEIPENELFDLLDCTETTIPNELLNQSKDRLHMILNYTPPEMSQEMVLIKALNALKFYHPIDHPTNHWSLYNPNKIICYSLNSDHEHIINKENSRLAINFLIQNKWFE